MPIRKSQPILQVLAALCDVDKPIPITTLMRAAGVRYETVNRALEVLKEWGFIVEELNRGPPMRRLIQLTDKGREAAKCAKRILELAGLI